MAQLKEQEQRDIQDEGPPPKVTGAGTRYRDIEDGDETKGTVKDGDDVAMYFKVLKLGKRSYDGLSGEGTVVFSRGECKHFCINSISFPILLLFFY